MDELAVDSDPVALDELVADDPGFTDQARCRATLERDVVEWAIDELESLIDERGVDLDPLLEYARRSRQSLPDRHDRAYEAMADVFDVDPSVYEAYVFAFSELCEELADNGCSEKSPRGCTNALVARSTVDLESASGPLVLKNRDIAGRGVRPKAIVEQPPIDGYYGFLTVDTCGTISIFKGVNDQGLVAANTYIDSERDDIDPENQLRNGTIIRMLLEETATVAEARTLLESYPTRQLMGQTLFLADETDACVLEIDPVTEQMTVDEGRSVRGQIILYTQTRRRQRVRRCAESEHRAYSQVVADSSETTSGHSLGITKMGLAMTRFVAIQNPASPSIRSVN